jgi:uncharacterized membrane protein
MRNKNLSTLQKIGICVAAFVVIIGVNICIIMLAKAFGA